MSQTPGQPAGHAPTGHEPAGHHPSSAIDGFAWDESAMVLLIQNDNAESVASNYVHCDRSNWRVRPGGLKKEYTGMMVRPDLREMRHGQEEEKSRGGDKMPGSPRPEQEDAFVVTTAAVEVVVPTPAGHAPAGHTPTGHSPTGHSPTVSR